MSAPSYYRQGLFIAKGLSNFTKSAFEKAATKFSDADMVADLANRHFLVTGANSGIGFETTQQLLTRGATVHMVCRSQSKGEQARSELTEKTGCQPYLHLVDLSQPKQIKAFARAFVAAKLPLHCLVNNAGVMIVKRQKTSDDLEYNTAVNTIGTIVMTEELLPALQRTSESESKDNAGNAFKPRVITVASGGQYSQSLLSSLDDLQCNNITDKYFDGTNVYAANKRQQVAVTEEWGRLYDQKPSGSNAATAPVAFHTMHPGWCDTPALQQSMPDFHAKMKDSLMTTSQGCDTIVWLATHKDVDALAPSGQFWLSRQPQSKHLALAWTKYKDDETRVLLYNVHTLAKPIEPSDAESAAYAYMSAENFSAAHKPTAALVVSDIKS